MLGPWNDCDDFAMGICVEMETLGQILGWAGEEQVNR